MEYPVSFADCKAYALGLFKSRSHIQDSDILSLIEYRFSFAVIEYRLTKYQCPANRSTKDNALIKNFELSYPELAIEVSEQDVRHKLCNCVSQEEREKNLMIVKTITKTLISEEEPEKSSFESLMQDKIILESHGTIPSHQAEIFFDSVSESDDSAIELFTFEEGDQINEGIKELIPTESEVENEANCASKTLNCDEDIEETAVLVHDVDYVIKNLGDHSQNGDNIMIHTAILDRPCNKMQFRDHTSLVIHDDLPEEIQRHDGSKCAAALNAINGLHNNNKGNLKGPINKRRAIRGSLIFDFGHRMTKLRVQIGKKFFTLPKTATENEEKYLDYLQRRCPTSDSFELLMLYYWWILQHNELAVSTTALNCIHHRELRKWKFSNSVLLPDEARIARLII